MRLFTRSDFDGLVCAALLKELGVVGRVCFVHPKDVQDNKIRVGKNDVVANLPYVEGCGLWFDHHFSEITRLKSKVVVKGAYELLPSAARVIFNYYRSRPRYLKAVQRFAELVRIADIIDTASFSADDILNPQGWIILAFITDPRSNFGKNQSFKTSNLDLMQSLPDLLRKKTVHQIISLPDFHERIIAYRKDIQKFKQILIKNSSAEGSAVIIDFRGKENIPIGNRFLEYVLYPQQNISIRIVDGKNKGFVMISVGHSIINQTSDINVGNLMLRYGGGGHQNAGTCQIAYPETEIIIQEILHVINQEHANLNVFPEKRSSGDQPQLAEIGS